MILTNLLGLLTGFALLADYFETSHLPAVLPKFFRIIGKARLCCPP